MKASVSYSRLNREENPTITFIHKNNPFSIDNMNIILANKKVKVRIITKNEDYENNCQKLKWKCIDCGFEYERSWADFISNNNTMLCPKCIIKNSSYISFLVMEYLNEKNIEYEREKKFDGCINKRKLPFDFYLPLNNILIEVDGKQHFEKVKFANETEEQLEKKFEYRKTNDKIKDCFCKENNIKLIRLPYWLFRNNEFIKILDKELNT